MIRSDPAQRFQSARTALIGLLLLGAVALGLYAILWFVQFRGQLELAPWNLVRQEGATDALLSFSEVTVAVLGITITVVAIVVELAANRYTPRISDLFVRDPINIAVMSSFAISATLVMWINLSLASPEYPSTLAVAATVLMSGQVLAILPYFAYVFDFLSPTRIIRRIQQNGSSSFHRLAGGRGTVDRARQDVILAMEQLGDIGLNSVDKKDKPLAIASVLALADLMRDHIDAKKDLPTPWFDSSELVHIDQDFVAFHGDIVRALTHRHTWVEMKILRQYQAVFGEAVNRMRDVNHLIAIQTRRLARFCHERGDTHAMNLCIRYMNTYMRAGINARDVRTCYNLLNEYRLMAEYALAVDSQDRVVELAEYIKFYGQLAFSQQLAFILESSAYDLCALLEMASDRQAACHDQLLGLFLDVDREPEDGKVQEASLRGVRKAQIKLATHYLVRGSTEPARRIFEDMRSEKTQRLRSIRREFESVEDAEYWEVSDRGINFEWLPPERRATLDTFFGWFDRL